VEYSHVRLEAGWCVTAALFLLHLHGFAATKLVDDTGEGRDLSHDEVFWGFWVDGYTDFACLRMHAEGRLEQMVDACGDVSIQPRVKVSED